MNVIHQYSGHWDRLRSRALGNCGYTLPSNCGPTTGVPLNISFNVLPLCGHTCDVCDKSLQSLAATISSRLMFHKSPNESRQFRPKSVFKFDLYPTTSGLWWQIDKSSAAIVWCQPPQTERLLRLSRRFLFDFVCVWHKQRRKKTFVWLCVTFDETWEPDFFLCVLEIFWMNCRRLNKRW